MTATEHAVAYKGKSETWRHSGTPADEEADPWKTEGLVPVSAAELCTVASVWVGTGGRSARRVWKG